AFSGRSWREVCGSGPRRLSWMASLLDSRTVALHFRISSGFIRSAPQPPNPPALMTAIDSDGALAPAIGAKRIGTCMPKRLQNAAERSLKDIGLLLTKGDTVFSPS